VTTDATTPPLEVDTIYLPLTTPAGSIGVLGLTSRPARRFTRHHKEFLKSLSAEAAIAVENAQLRSELRNMAVTDYLTGLANRREVERVLAAECERATSQGRSVAVLMMDVDNLKALNDRYGHAAGDEALCALARVLKRTLGPKDTAGRVGGDEFLVVLPGATAAQGKHVAELLIQEYHHELAKADLPIDAGSLAALSAGVAASDDAMGIGDGGASGANLVSLADAALYQAKRSGKRQVRVGSLAGVAAG
jgi:diguanylate cyclase (GGDEF)-like protein